jgi:hypothetical protein
MVACSGGRGDHVGDLLEMRFTRKRTEQASSLLGFPWAHVLRVVGQGGNELVVDAGLNENARGRGAVLAGVEVTGNRDAFNRALEVDVIENDDGALPPSSR